MLLLFTIGALPGAAQGSGPALSRLVRVFLDCSAGVCEPERIVQDIEFVTWVREPQDADVHVLISSTASDAGTYAYRLAFVGRAVFLGDDLELDFVTPDWYVAEQRTSAYLESLKVGLTRYAAQSPAAQDLLVTYSLPIEPVASAATVTTQSDPWKGWVFQLDLGGRMTAESASSSHETQATLRINRTTAASKVLWTAYGSTIRDEFTFDDRTYKSSANYYGSNLLLVRSAGEHWGWGVRSALYSSTYDNTELLLSLAPALEYNFFPYSQSASRHLTLEYSAGWNRYDFYEETLYGRLRDDLWDHRILIDTEIRHVWGSLGVSGLASQFWSDPERYRLRFASSLNYRLTRGLSFTLSGRYEIIRDQIALPRAGATEEEVLLRRRALETQYRAFLNVGFQFRVGSSFVNVVNSRLDTR